MKYWAGKYTVPVDVFYSYSRCYPVINSSGVHLGKLCVHINIKVDATQHGKSTQKKVTSDQPEFVVGPGARHTERETHVSSSSKDIDTMTSGLDKPVSSRVMFSTRPSTLREIRIPTGESEVEESSPKKAELGAQQIEVISELIERGQQLRSKMVESILNQRTEREESSNKKQEQLS